MKLIDKDALVAEIEKIKEGLLRNCNPNPLGNSQECLAAAEIEALDLVVDSVNSLEAKEVDEVPQISFPHYNDIVGKVFGAGNLESWEYEDAEQLVFLAKEELLKDLEVKEVDLDFQRFAKEMDTVFALPSSKTENTEEEPLNWEYSIAKHFFELGLKVQHDNWKVENLWKPANGDDLPEYDREVIVLIKYNAQRNIHDEEDPTYRVGFGHRPNPDGWDGKNIATNEVTHYTPKLYDKGGWNIPNIKYWLDCLMPKEIEQ